MRTRDGKFVVKVDSKGSAMGVDKAETRGLPPADPDLDPNYALKAGLGYVEIDGGPVCGNCEYQKDGKCVFLSTHPFQVDLVNGSCSFWEADESPEGEASEDWLADAKNRRHG